MAAKFIGACCRSLDAKGRLLLPPKYLAALREHSPEAPSFWLTILYGRLTAYPPSLWQEIVAKICAVPTPTRQLADFKTKLIGMAEELAPDAQGRIRIPRALMRAGDLGKDIVLVGLLDKFEIWDQARFDALPCEDVSQELAASNVMLPL